MLCTRVEQPDPISSKVFDAEVDDSSMVVDDLYMSSEQSSRLGIWLEGLVDDSES